MRKPWMTKEWRDKRIVILKIRNCCEWCGSKEFLTLDHLSKPYKFNYDEYMKLKDEDIIVLCRRCAYARKKGYVLCHNCKKKYHSPRYDVCSTCQGLTMEYKLPCNNFVTILKEDFKSPLFSTLEVCMHRCRNEIIGGDVNNCDDFKRFAS